MSQSTILALLPQTVYNNDGTSQPYDVTGNAQPAAAYYLGNQDLQTVSYNFTEVTGNLIIKHHWHQRLLLKVIGLKYGKQQQTTLLISTQTQAPTLT